MIEKNEELIVGDDEISVNIYTKVCKRILPRRL
jgi:hypothetical protein